MINMTQKERQQPTFRKYSSLHRPVTRKTYSLGYRVGKCLLKEVRKNENGVSNISAMSRESVPRCFANSPVTHTLCRVRMQNAFGQNLLKAASDT